MRVLKLLRVILYFGNLIHASTEVPPSALFGEQYSRGAYARVRTNRGGIKLWPTVLRDIS